MDMSVKKTQLTLRWSIPPKTYFYGTSKVIVNLTTPDLCTIGQAPALIGLLRIEINVENSWSLLEVSLQFNGYTSKRLTTLFRGRIVRRVKGKDHIFKTSVFFKSTSHRQVISVVS